MRWLTNAADHRKEDRYYDANDPTGEYRRQWLADKIIGRPKAGDKYTVEELEAMGMIGIYTSTDATLETK